jgi:polyisoprenoid-binding protein YceI
MKTPIGISTTTLLSLALLLGLGTAKAQDIKYKGSPGSEVKIDGTSNIHDWTIKGQIISGSMDVNSAFDKDLKTVSPPPKVDVSIPVRSLKSGNGKMDEVMQEHMNFKQYKTIAYQLTGLTVKSEPKSANGPGEYTSTGDLTINGVKKSIEMPVTIERPEPGKLRVKGSIPIKMTDFKVEPPAPKLAMGLIKTGDDVKVSIDWVLTKAADTASK